MPPFLEGPSDVFDLYNVEVLQEEVKDIRWALNKGGNFASLWGGGKRWLSKGKFPRCHNIEITLKHHVGVSLLIRKLYLLTGKVKKFLLLTKKALESF